MAKKKKVLILFVIFVLIIGAVLCWQFDNLKAVYYSMSYSDEDIDKLVSENNNEVRSYIESNSSYNVRPSEEVEEKLHQTGIITDEELVDIITGTNSVESLFGIDVGLTPNKNFVNTADGKVVGAENLIEMKDEIKKNESKSETTNPDSSDKSNEENSAETEKKDNSKKISECIASLYVLKSSFIGRLDGLYSEAISYYKSLPASERKNAKSEIVKRFYGRGTALEAECDSQVAALLAELKTLLSEEGSDMTLISKIQAAYNNEKSLKKAQYLNKL